MSKIQFTLVKGEEGQNISVFIPGFDPQVAHSSHPNFNAILDGAFDDDPSIIDLFDVAVAASKRFDRLTERITTANGRLYLDGVEVHNSLATQVVRFLNDGVDDWKPLVRFFEHVQSNPNDHSREQLFNWLDRRDFTITDSGLIVGYKGVKKHDDGSLWSISSGKAIVNGEVKSGSIPNPLGAIIEMPRDQVQWDPSVGCHTGLHVGDYAYASGFAQGALLEVHVNPRDVVSVPTDCDWAKVRCCRYRVVGVIDKPYEEAYVHDPYDWDDDDFEWGERNEDEDYTDEDGYIVSGYTGQRY